MSVAFSHDSKLLVLASYDNTVKVWDAATGSLQQTLYGNSGTVWSVAFSHDSKLLASASYTVKV
jgi:WD40 repeat protein